MLDLQEMRQRQAAADQAFLHAGITFTVYGRAEGTERIFPYDLIPRLITGSEWDRLERGLTQRITALNLFLKDVYSDARVLHDRIVPRDLIYSCRHYRREMRGVRPRYDVFVSVAGTDSGASDGAPLLSAPVVTTVDEQQAYQQQQQQQ